MTVKVILPDCWKTGDYQMAMPLDAEPYSGETIEAWALRIVLTGCVVKFTPPASVVLRVEDAPVSPKLKR